jgi:hypothetical protein
MALTEAEGEGNWVVGSLKFSDASPLDDRFRQVGKILSCAFDRRRMARIHVTAKASQLRPRIAALMRPNSG